MKNTQTMSKRDNLQLKSNPTKTQTTKQKSPDDIWEDGLLRTFEKVLQEKMEKEKNQKK